MQTIKTKKELKNILNSKRVNGSIGLVPTMGALHKGHLALVKKALSENNTVVVSIFVNPTQFNNTSDLEKYPKTLNQDCILLKELSNELIVFTPSTTEMYPEKTQATQYNFQGLDMVMEGAHRPGHFDGVGTIVKRFLTIVSPDRAYFGEKDYQQLQIIKKLVDIEKLPVEIIGCPIVREASGLAMSSRNSRLSVEDRKEAACIYAILQSAKDKFGTKSALYIKNWVHNEFKKQANFNLEYVDIVEESSLKSISRKSKHKKYRIFIAVFISEIRLIDNIALN